MNMSSDKVGKVILFAGLISILIFLTYTLLRRNELLENSASGYVRVVSANKGRKGITTSATYLELLVILPDSSFRTHRKLPVGANVSAGSCYSMSFAKDDVNIFDVDFTSVVICPN